MWGCLQSCDSSCTKGSYLKGARGALSRGITLTIRMVMKGFMSCLSWGLIHDIHRYTDWFADYTTTWDGLVAFCHICHSPILPQTNPRSTGKIRATQTH